MITLKALSIKQPAANKIAAGVKTIEVRTWPTKYRGPILVVSSKNPRIEPAGCALAVVDLVECQPMREEHTTGACCQLYPECYSWILENPRPIRPVPMRGSLGLFGVDVESVDMEDGDRAEIEQRLRARSANLELEF